MNQPHSHQLDLTACTALLTSQHIGCLTTPIDGTD